MAAIKVSLATISGLHAHAEQPDQINCPAAWPALVGVAFDETFDSDEAMRFEINVAATSAANGLAKGYALSYPYMSGSGTKSIKTALELDPTLGGVVEALVVSEAAAIGLYETAGLTYIGGKLTLLVYP